MEASTIKPEPPDLGELTWRSVGDADLAALVELAEACRLFEGQGDGGLAFLNKPENLKSRYLPEAPGAGIGAFTTTGRLAACATVHLFQESDRERAAVIGQVRPDFRNRGIGTYLLRWSEAQAQTLFTANGPGERLLQIASESLTEPAEHLYRAFGYQRAMEELVMQRDLKLPLPDRPLPAGVNVMAWQPGLAAQFYEAYRSSFGDRPGFPGWSAAEWISNRLEDENAIAGWSLLARLGDEPVGFLTAGTEHPGGFVVQVGVVPRQRRRGLGTALMVESMRRMQAAGEVAVQLTVNINNPGATEAYEKLDFFAVGRRGRYQRIAE